LNPRVGTLLQIMLSPSSHTRFTRPRLAAGAAEADASPRDPRPCSGQADEDAATPAGTHAPTLRS